jgi:hypothetical protein
MLFMLTVMGDADYEAGKPPPPAAVEAMEKLLAEQFAAGRLKHAGGLAPSATGMKIRARDGRIAYIDGPFTEAKEVVGGYAFFEAPSKAEAVEFVTRFIDVHLDAGIANVDVELRQVMGGPDAD